MQLWKESAESFGPIHFIGLGGIGMSGLAEVLADQGVAVQGSDLSDNASLKRLADKGVAVFHDHAAKNIGDAKLVVVSTAIKPDNPELQAAETQGIKVIHRAELLAAIAANYKTVVVTGTHGKTSTTALIYAALQAAGEDVGIINGGVLNSLGTNAKLGSSKWLVLEADESDASFLKLAPTIAVVTNIEPEHMETYGSEEKLYQAFQEFIELVPEDGGCAVICADDERLNLLGSLVARDVLTYGLEEGADVYAKMYCPSQLGMAFDAVLRGGTLEDCQVAMPGNHFVQNALAALTVAQVLSLDIRKAAEGLKRYQGVGRRFSLVGQYLGADVIDDYAHHPTEIAATLEAAKRKYADQQVIAVVQPHRYSRLRDHMADFAKCTKVADHVVLLPVHAAGEDPIPGVDHMQLAHQMEGDIRVLEDNDGLADTLNGLVEPGDCILCMGAGSISGLAKKLGQQA